MKRSILEILVVLILMMSIFVLTAQAATVTWDASTGDPLGYIVYYSSVDTEQFSKDVGEVTSVDIDTLDLTPGTWTFYVTAYNALGESGPSNSALYEMAAYEPIDNPKPTTIVIPGPVTIQIGQ